MGVAPRTSPPCQPPSGTLRSPGVPSRATVRLRHYRRRTPGGAWQDSSSTWWAAVTWSTIRSRPQGAVCSGAWRRHGVTRARRAHYAAALWPLPNGGRCGRSWRRYVRANNGNRAGLASPGGDEYLRPGWRPAGHVGHSLLSVRSRTSTLPPPVDVLRQWRQRRRLAAGPTALDAEVSTRHLELRLGPAAPPHQPRMLLLAERLDVPLRRRNALLLGSYAPMYPERWPTPRWTRRGARSTSSWPTACLPALVVDRWWNILSHNAAVPVLLERRDPPSCWRHRQNTLRLALHPGNGAAHRELRRLARPLRLHKPGGGEAPTRQLAWWMVRDRRAHAPRRGPAPACVAVPRACAPAAAVLELLSTTDLQHPRCDAFELALETFFQPTLRQRNGCASSITITRAMPPRHPLHPQSRRRDRHEGPVP